MLQTSVKRGSWAHINTASTVLQGTQDTRLRRIKLAISEH